MAWMAAHLFVHCPESDPVVGALGELLEGEEHRVDLEGFDDLPGALVVCPVHEGWVAVTGAGAWFDDLPWVAERLSKVCGGQVFSSELFSNCYRLRLVQCDDGKREQILCTPDAEWGEEPPPRAQMPLYDDVEQEAFTTLRDAGIPPALIAVGTTPFGIDGDTPLGTGTTLLRGPGGIERGELAVRLPALSADHGDAPVVPMELSQDFGLMFFEDRYVEGEPREESLKRLFELEDAYGARARRLEAEPDKVSLTFSYHAGPHQERLNQLLQAHDRHTVASVTASVRIPWWQFWRYFGRLR
jgi:hypothetical protein